MTTYKLSRSIDGNVDVVIRDDRFSIPFDPANTDYQIYLEWLAEGNEPLPADEPIADAE